MTELVTGFDIVLGWVYAVAAVTAGHALLRYWARRRAAAAEPALGEPATS